MPLHLNRSDESPPVILVKKAREGIHDELGRVLHIRNLPFDLATAEPNRRCPSTRDDAAMT